MTDPFLCIFPESERDEAADPVPDFLFYIDFGALSFCDYDQGDDNYNRKPNEPHQLGVGGKVDPDETNDDEPDQWQCEEIPVIVAAFFNDEVIKHSDVQ